MDYEEFKAYALMTKQEEFHHAAFSVVVRNDQAINKLMQWMNNCTGIHMLAKNGEKEWHSNDKLNGDGDVEKSGTLVAEKSGTLVAWLFNDDGVNGRELHVYLDPEMEEAWRTHTAKQ